jgi:hypothetical protein
VRSPTFCPILPGTPVLIAFLLFYTLGPVPALAADSTSPPGAAGEKDLTVKLPATGDYLVWLEAQTASGQQAQAPVHVTGDRAALPLPAAPAGLKEWRVLALDEKSGYAAAQTLPAKDAPSSVSFGPPEFNRVHKVRVQVTGAGDKPVASASVTLTDSKGGTLSHVIDASAAGTTEFTDVPSGAAKLGVTATGGKTTTKEVDINLPKGEKLQTIAVPQPEITAVVEPTAGSAPPATSASPEKAAEPKPTSGDKSTPESKSGSTPAPASPAPEPAPSGGGFGTLVGLILLGGIGYGVYLVGKNQGWTIDKTLARLGVQPVPAVTAGSPAGTPAPPPPPVDPNVCAFCGQRKDPVTGNCACSLDASALGSASAGSAFSSSGSGPRLVAVSGLAMGQIFPINGEAAIGRDSGNAVPLSMDSTVSRRHAVIAPDGGGYVIRDQGSSNGTYVNGARVTEAPLRPGDEVSIGGTRFRFEA